MCDWASLNHPQPCCLAHNIHNITHTTSNTTTHTQPGSHTTSHTTTPLMMVLLRHSVVMWRIAARGTNYTLFSCRWSAPYGWGLGPYGIIFLCSEFKVRILRLKSELWVGLLGSTVRERHFDIQDGNHKLTYGRALLYVHTKSYKALRTINDRSLYKTWAIKR